MVIALLRLDETQLLIGMVSTSLGILISRVSHFEYSGFPVSDFIEGILTGLTLVMLLTYLIRRRARVCSC